jgi:hypothetical protein
MAQQDSISPDELAKLLDGHDIALFDDVVSRYGGAARDSGLVIVFGASDDLMELRGAIDDEVGCWEGGSAFISGGKLLVNECDERDDCPYFPGLRAKAFEVQSLWCDEGAEPYAWTYRLGVEHSDFDMLEDGQPWCRGVVFSLGDIDSAPFSLKPVVRDYAKLVRDLIQARTRRYCRAAEDATGGSFDFPGAFAAQVFKIFESVMEEGEADAVALCRELGFNPDDGTRSNLFREDGTVFVCLADGDVAEFIVERSGVQPGTPSGPEVHWAEGILRCPSCGAEEPYTTSSD